MKKQILAAALCLCMTLTMMPTVVFATDSTDAQQFQGMPSGLYTESNGNSARDLNEQSDSQSEAVVPVAPTQTPEQPNMNAMDEIAQSVQDLIDALPTADEIYALDMDGKQTVSDEIDAIDEAMEVLTTEQCATLGMAAYNAAYTALIADTEPAKTMASGKVTCDIVNANNMQYILYANGTPLYFWGTGGGYGYSRIYIDANRNGYDNSDVELTGTDLPGVQYVGGWGFYLGNSTVYGGSKGGDTEFDPYMTFAGASDTKSFWVVFGGNNGGTLTGNSTINIAGSNIGWGVLGGGYGSTQSGSTTVNMTAGFSNRIFGGGDNSTNTGNSSVSISGGSTNYAYGGTTGGGTLNGSTDVTISGGTVANRVYGGNYSGAVSGNTNITVSGGSVNYVFGGNQDSGKVTGNTYITFKDNANVTGWVYGGGAGTNDNDITEVGGSTNITINGGTLAHNIYGGGGWRGTKVGSTNITLNGGTVIGDIYGGGEEQSSVTGTAKITLNGGTVPYVLGAGAGFNNTAATVNNAEIYVNDSSAVTECITTGHGWNSATAYAVESATLTLNNATTTAYAGKSSSSSATVNLILKNFGSDATFYNIDTMPCSGSGTGFDNIVLENSYVTRTTGISDAVTVNSGSILWLNAQSVPSIQKLTGNGGVIWLTKNQDAYCRVDDGIHGAVVVRFVDNAGALVTPINGTALFNEELADSTGTVSLDAVYAELFVRQDKSSVANRLLTTVMTIGDDRTGPTINNLTVSAHGPYSYDATTTALDSESGVKAIYYACYPDGTQTPTAAEIVAEKHIAQNGVQFEIADIKTGRLEPATYNMIYAVAVDNAGNYSEVKSARHRTATEFLSNATVRIAQGESLVYTGSSVEPKVEVLFNGEVYDYDWEISYQFNVNVKETSKAVVVVKPGALSDRFIGQKAINFVIQPKPITITPTAGQNKPYGSTDPTYTYANTSLVGDDTITGTMERTEGEIVGTYSYTIGSLSAGSNYFLSLAQNPDKFEIVASAPTIAWSSTVQSLDWTGSEAAITAPTVTLSNNEIYNAVTNGSLIYQYRLSDSADETANWHDGLPINVGSYIIKASLSPKGNYATATSINQLSLTINSVEVTVTAPTAADDLVYDGTEKSGYITAATTVGNVVPANELVYTYTGTLTDGTAYNKTTAKPTKPGTYSLTVSVADNNPTYIGRSSPITFSIAKAPLTIQWKDLTQVYTGEVLKPSITFTGKIGTDSVYVTCAGQKNAQTVPYKITANLTGNEADYYTITNPATNFTIQKAPVYFTVTDDMIASTTATKEATVTATANGNDFKAFTVDYVQINASTYDIIATITDANYRHADGIDGSAQKIGVLSVYTVAPPATYTVTFTANGGIGDDITLTAVKADTRRVMPASDTFSAPTNQIFKAWSYNGKLYQPSENFEQPASNATVIAIWQYNYSITGAVTQKTDLGSSINSSDTVVTLMFGSEQIAQAVTDENGNYTFGKVAPGVYNLSAAKDGITKTIAVTIADSSASGQAIELPAKKTNSLVEVTAGSPTIVVDKVDEIFEKDSINYNAQDKEIVNAGGEVEIKLSATVTTDTETQNKLESAASNKNDTVALVIDLDLNKTVTDKDGQKVEEQSAKITETSILLTAVIQLPAQLQGKSSYVVYREHGDSIDTLTTTPDLSTGEYIEVNAEKTQITVHAKKFSAYAVAYNNVFTVTFDANGGSVTPATAQTNMDSKLESLPNPSRNGYRFNGWYDAVSGGEKITLAKIYTEDTTIFAQWTYNGGGNVPSVSTYTLIFETNGGTQISSVSKVNGTTIDLSDYKPTRTGYTFDGWYSDSKLTDKVTSVKLTKNTTVYAKWTEDVVAPIMPFSDVNTSDWFYDDVAYVFENKLMQGTGNSMFSPNATTTRGMIVTILYRLEGEPPVSGACPFDDVKAGSYYEKAITWAAENGIVGGYGNGKFGPDDSITREQMAAFLYRYADFKDYDVTGQADLSKFSDAANVSSYAAKAMAWTSKESLINGVGGNLLDPTGNATRAQVAAILHRFCENITK